MTGYLDTSFLVSLFVRDQHTPAALAYAKRGEPATYSTWGQTEYLSALGVLLRRGDLQLRSVEIAEANFDAWCARTGAPVAVMDEDVISARRLVARRDLHLRAPDALHLAVAARRRCSMVTFDKRMAAAADTLGLAVEPSP